MTLAKGHLSVVCQNCQMPCPLKLLSQFQLNFIGKLQAKGDGHMTKMATKPIYGK